MENLQMAIHSTVMKILLMASKWWDFMDRIKTVMETLLIAWFLRLQYIGFLKMPDTQYDWYGARNTNTIPILNTSFLIFSKKAEILVIYPWKPKILLYWVLCWYLVMGCLSRPIAIPGNTNLIGYISIDDCNPNMLPYITHFSHLHLYEIFLYKK